MRNKKYSKPDVQIFTFEPIGILAGTIKEDSNNAETVDDGTLLGAKENLIFNWDDPLEEAPRQ